jgi:hypothetical protein
MMVPHYRRDRQQPNNVASIWLLRDSAKHVCFSTSPERHGGVLFHVRLLFGSNLPDWSQ